MALSTSTMRGLIRYLPGTRKGVATGRHVVWPETTTPTYGNHIRPTSEPSGTAAKGDWYFSSTLNCLMQHTGSAWEEVGASLTSLATGAITGTTLDLTGAATVAGGLNYKQQVTDTGGAYATPIVLTEAQSGRVILLDDAAGLDFTLPAVAAAQVGTWYKFITTVTITSNNLRVTAATGDLLRGGVVVVDFDTANTLAYFTPDESDDLIYTANGSTKGGKKGSVVTFTAIHATGWFVEGLTYGDGTLATPFA